VRVLPRRNLSIGLAISPDGKWLLYTQTDDEQSDILLAQPVR